MNFQQIEYIIAVSELRNFSKAADRCCITQSTLSTMVARFEEEIGITIFDRKSKPVSITKEGEVIIRQLKVIAHETANLDEIASGLKGEKRGQVKIAVIPTVAPYILHHFLTDFIADFPDIQFSVSEMTTGEITQALLSRELDIGIVSVPLGNELLHEYPLYNEPFILYDREQAGNFPPNIDFSRLWLLEEGHCFRTQAISLCGLQEKQAKEYNLEYKSGTIHTLLKFVNKNKGITLLPWLAGEDLGDDDKQFLKAMKNPVPGRTIGLLVHRHFVKHSLLNQLANTIQKAILPLLADAGNVEEIVKPT
jgi:LysR family hydrogen peroxide-inducible transcriptional activator